MSINKSDFPPNMQTDSDERERRSRLARAMLSANWQQLCHQYKIRVTDKPVISSVDLARIFDKPHEDILRDIDALLANLEADPRMGDVRSSAVDGLTGWYRPASYVDPPGITRRAFDMTYPGVACIASASWNSHLWARLIAVFSEAERQIEQAETEKAVKLAVRDRLWGRPN